MSAAELNQGILDAALEISAARAQTLREVKSLFESGKDAEAVTMIKVFLNVKVAKTSSGKLVRFPR